METKSKIVILGGGPGSLFAYYGALASGIPEDRIEIWADKLTYPKGAFWIHQLPPNAPTELKGVTEKMDIHLVGDAETYSRKQWGEEFPTSVSRYAGKTLDVYNPSVVLPAMWEAARKTTVGINWTYERIRLLAESYHTVIATFPVTEEAESLMRREDSRIPVYVAPTADNEGVNYCVYNGLRTQIEVRITRAFGYLCIEYPRYCLNQMDRIQKSNNRYFGLEGRMVTVPEMHPTVQPIQQRVYGPRNNILVTGRWATLDRKALSHNSFWDTYYHLCPDVIREQLDENSE